jgi:redox-sensitive bicupin YhaK (pirin superfamily)
MVADPDRGALRAECSAAEARAEVIALHRGRVAQDGDMSVQPHAEPVCHEAPEPVVELEIAARTRSLGDGFDVRRLLPTAARRIVGPFVFVDHMGPVTFEPGKGIDVRPHPHINLATVTYLFDGEFLHRDSLGSEQPIRPGAVNWMTAGRGIAHSERSPDAMRASGARAHGLQLWCALPTAHEEDEPSFQHHPADAIPSADRTGSRIRVIAGSAYGESSPVSVLSPLFYVEAKLEANASLAAPEEYRERAAYVVSGTIAMDEKTYGAGTMLVLRAGTEACVRALEASHVMLLGGEPLDGARHIWWNFVSSSKERIEQAKLDWREGRFGKIPGDDVEFIPLPE